MDGQIHIAVGSEQKREWKDYVEESGQFSSLTNLIRTAVEKERTSDQQGGVESPVLLADIDDLKESVERIKKDVRWIKDYHHDEDTISELAKEVADSLVTLPKSQGGVQIPPDVEDEKTYRRELAALTIITPDSAEDDSSPQTISAIADRLDDEEDEVRDAMEFLQDKLHPVVEVKIDGKTHYFEEK